mmetsp:Transcript_24908/g.43770  ORF Transcript_24908/g.43770 Transcript_24908/m.43770 type:complete len:206 (+) Transcript_24908:164-781(+)
MLLNTLLKDYTARIFSRETLLVRILGVFKLQCIDNFAVDLMVMENIACGYGTPLFKFDLKGSTHDRLHKKTPRLGSKNFMKDLDFMEEVGKLDLIESDRARFLKALEEDVEMLVKNGVIDYSLFGAYYEDQEMPQGNKYCYRHKLSPNSYYTLGIIDILQDYNSKKRCEHWLKRIFRRASHSAISSVNPSRYGRRFLDFCRSICE